MRLQINDTEVVFPSSLSEFTLGQRIDFYNQYGRQLDDMMLSTLSMEEGFEKEMELMHFQFEKMFRTFAFFAGTTPEALQESEFINDIANIYHANLAALLDDEQAIDLKTEYVWNGEIWELHIPELKNGSKMKFGEFIDSKQLIKDMADLGAGKWESMLHLCAIYLRRQGEEYQDSFLYENSDRIELMRSLPMDIALSVGFFLSSSVNSYMNTLLFSTQAEQNQTESLVLNTLIDGVGSIS
jgi:hypothetical protein